jgi:hypothetical protein
MVRLQVVVNEQGLVSSARIIGGGNPVIQQPVWQAVREWRYFPTYKEGEAIPVIAEVSAGCDNPGSGSALYLIADERGGLRTADLDADGKWSPGGLVSDEQLRATKGAIFLVAPPEIPFSKIELAAKNLSDSGIAGFQFQNRDLAFKDGHLFCVGDANGIKPPELSIRGAMIASMARASGRLGSATGLAYHVYIIESGRIDAVERFDGPEIPDVEAALKTARVVTPARRGDMPVPVMITIAMQFQD